ncbi:MAG: hypothetical protein R3Y10_13590, partial [Ferrimonas sp.]
NMVAHTFYVTWFAFASFEKGELFGLDNVIATTNTNPENLKNYKYNDQYKRNVRPFLQAPNQQEHNNDEDSNALHGLGAECRVVSYALSAHPLKQWIDAVMQWQWPDDEKNTKKSTKKITNKPKQEAWLCEQLGAELDKTLDNSLDNIRAQLIKMALNERKALLDRMTSLYSRSSKAKDVLIASCENNESSEQF